MFLPFMNIKCALANMSLAKNCLILKIHGIRSCSVFLQPESTFTACLTHVSKTLQGNITKHTCLGFFGMRRKQRCKNQASKCLFCLVLVFHQTSVESHSSCNSFNLPFFPFPFLSFQLFLNSFCSRLVAILKSASRCNLGSGVHGRCSDHQRSHCNALLCGSISHIPALP